MDASLPYRHVQRRPEPRRALSAAHAAGLSAWDTHVGYRNLRVHPVLQPPPNSPPPKQHRAAQQPWEGVAGEDTPAAPRPQSGAPSLLHCCQAALQASMSPASVCDLLQVADCLAPVLDDLRRWVGGR